MYPSANALGYLIAKRASGRSVRGLPVQAILLSRCADDLLRILVHSRIIANFRCVFLLRLDVNVAHLDCVQFIGANAPKQDFLTACRGVELPFAVPLDQRGGHGPLLVTHDDGGAITGFAGSTCTECLAWASFANADGIVFVLDWIRRGNKILAIRAKYCQHLGYIENTCGFYEGFRALLRGVETFRPLRRTWCRGLGLCENGDRRHAEHSG